MPEPTFDHDKKPIEPSAKTESGKQEKAPANHPLTDLQQQLGNRAVQRLIQRSGGEGAFDLDEETASRINSARGGGQSLDENTKEQMSSAMGYDFSGVNVHTSRESDELNKEVGAKAFTTGNDIFFKEGEYDPATSDGQELIAHELAHVVQQGTGKASGEGGSMTVNAPGDTHEKEADQAAKAAIGQGSEGAVQMQEAEPEVQMQEEEEDELAQMQEDEEEELAQMQPIEEEEEEMQP